MKKSEETNSRMKQLGIKKQEHYSKAEIQRIVKAANGSGTGIAVQIVAETGIRQSELSALKWEQVDTKTRRIDIAPDKAVAISKRLAKMMDTFKANKLGAEFIFDRFVVHSMMV